MSPGWTRLFDWMRRWWRRAPSPGRWIEGTTFTFSGFVGYRFWALPRRRYRLYVPQGFKRSERMPLLVLLHGCRQSGVELAQGTRIASLADAQRLLVLMPEQEDGANPYRCWNWFDSRTAAGKGEAAIVAKMLARAARRWRANPSKVCVAGLSAGGALAAILGVRYPGLVRSVITHAGIACGAVAHAYTALSVMQRGPETDVAAIATRAREDAGTALDVPLLAIHGSADDVVAPRHAAALARQYLALNGVAVPAGSETTLPPPDAESRDAAALPHVIRTREWRRNERPLVRLVEIENLGHAWSGGDPAVSFMDGAAPDATAIVGKWIEELAG